MAKREKVWITQVPTFDFCVVRQRPGCRGRCSFFFPLTAAMQMQASSVKTRNALAKCLSVQERMRVERKTHIHNINLCVSVCMLLAILCMNIFVST